MKHVMLLMLLLLLPLLLSLLLLLLLLLMSRRRRTAAVSLGAQATGTKMDVPQQRRAMYYVRVHLDVRVA